MDTTIPAQIEKCKGAMLLTAVGDAMGWPNEPRAKNREARLRQNDFFVEWTRNCKRPSWHNEKILPGEYSDDTQMTLSVARSIIAGDWEKFFIEKELPFWLQYERGGGKALLKAARSLRDKHELLWKSANPKDYFRAGGNGAAMRILPHVIASANKVDITALMIDIIKDTLITHGHPRAFLGATCYAFALDYLVKKRNVLEYGELVSSIIEGQQYWGEFALFNHIEEWVATAELQAGFDYAKQWKYDKMNMIEQLYFIEKELKKGLMLNDKQVLASLGCFGKANGAGDISVLAAIYLASKYATNPFLGVKVPAFSFHADTDTIASMTGGLLGMLCGIDWIPVEWRMVQDYDCLIQMAELLLSENKDLATRTKLMETKEQNSDWISSPIGRMRLINTNGKYGRVTIEKWQTMLGQTIYIKRGSLTQELLLQGDEVERQIQLDVQPSVSSQDNLRSNTFYQIGLKDGASKVDIIENNNRQLILSDSVIRNLLGTAEFNKSVTVGKFLKVVQALIEDDEPASVVSKRFTIDMRMVEKIKKYIDK
ncbi:ADP-ribosylglycohydrolase family protein [Selenomonas noxia]|uniref:ADP-ribosylglycohydrolase family protein n=1 Tax=Selenomonas noxia TaxID=135083 RepID=UPI0028D8262D|nr:ADP-ribosylglycohydrolase family protein [Selenomonas noxia]